MTRSSAARRRVEQITLDGAGVTRRRRHDALATEEPLEIRVVRPEEVDGRPVAEVAHRISVTMRTPGADFELAAGFLFTEGVLNTAREIASIRYCVDAVRDGVQQYNIVNVYLAPDTTFDPGSLQRNFYTTSSCGVCGKTSIEALEVSCARVQGDATVDAATLVSLPEKLRGRQRIFERTGGLHAAALFSTTGEPVLVREDVGRHNAMDKLVGAAWLAGDTPLTDRIALMSGRLSFELVQKAARAGVSILAGVSAPSSLAVETAERLGVTLVGFLRDRRFNVYTGGERIA